MELNIIIPLIGRRVKINLRDNFYYIGTIINIQSNAIVFKDKRDRNVLIDISDVVRIEERPIMNETNEDENGFE